MWYEKEIKLIVLYNYLPKMPFFIMKNKKIYKLNLENDKLCSK